MSKWFKGIKTLEELKKEYKKLAKMWHPDINANGSEAMKEINAEYEMMVKELAEGKTQEQKNNSYDVAMQYKDIIMAIINLEGLKIELCGLWLWVSGNTKIHKEELKKVGFWWASKKKMWYWRPEEAKTYNRKNMSMEKIREKYGSKIISGVSGYKPVLV